MCELIVCKISNGGFEGYQSLICNCFDVLFLKSPQLKDSLEFPFLHHEKNMRNYKSDTWEGVCFVYYLCWFYFFLCWWCSFFKINWEMIEFDVFSCWWFLTALAEAFLIDGFAIYTKKFLLKFMPSLWLLVCFHFNISCIGFVEPFLILYSSSLHYQLAWQEPEDLLLDCILRAYSIPSFFL